MTYKVFGGTLSLTQSISLSVTHIPCLNGSRYRNAFCTIWYNDFSSFCIAKFCGLECWGSPRTSVL